MGETEKRRDRNFQKDEIYKREEEKEKVEMSFMEEIVRKNIPIWDACAKTPFIRELQAGVLPAEKFRRYMIQDSIYLKNYARVYGKAIYHSTNLKDIQVYYSILSMVTEEESLVRLSYLKKFGLTDADIEDMEALPENQRYIDFLMEVAEGGDIPGILMAVLPCMLSYSYIFRKIAVLPGTADSEYSDFIEDYAEDAYFESCRGWCEFAEEKCGNLPEEEKVKLSDIFERASLLELSFWEMAYL